MEELVLIKLGGSLITDKEVPGAARPETITRLAGEIAAARRGSPIPLILGHGSGSFGHPAARDHDLRGKLESERQKAGASVTQVHAARLHRRVVEALHEAGALPFSIAPSSCLVTEAGEVAELAAEPVVRALGLGLLPVVYGDVVTDRRWGATVASTEAVLLELARRLAAHGFRPSRILWLGETDGILDREGQRVPTVTAANLDEVRGAIGEPRGTDVTGGMALRLETAWRLAGLGIASHVLDGRVAGALEEALRGAPAGGTSIPAIDRPEAMTAPRP